MIDVFVYRTLSGDTQLRELLGASDEDSRIDPRVTAKKTRVVVYKVVPVSADGHFRTDRIEIRLIDRDDDHIRAIQERVLALLLMREGDAPRTLSLDDLGKIAVYACVQNGGGELEDGYDIHRLLYFNVKWRYLN